MQAMYLTFTSTAKLTELLREKSLVSDEKNSTNGNLLKSVITTIL